MKISIPVSVWKCQQYKNATAWEGIVVMHFNVNKRIARNCYVFVIYIVIFTIYLDFFIYIGNKGIVQIICFCKFYLQIVSLILMEIREFYNYLFML
jgi:hypothetical protein